MKKGYFLAVVLFTLSIAVFLGHFLFFRYTFPDLNIDEASFFSPAYNFAEKGNFSTDIHTTFLPGSSSYTYWMPPLYMVTLGAIFIITGPSVFVAKLVSFVFILLTAAVLSFLSKDNKTKIWLVALLLICPFVILSSSFIRMEAMSILIVSIAIVAVKYNLKTPYLGIIAAAAVMTHPVLLAPAAGLAFVSMRRGFRELVYFSLVFFVLLIPYLYYISLDFELFKDQMTLQLLRKANRHFTDSKIKYVAQSLPISIVSAFLLWKVKTSRELKLFLFVGLTLSLVVVLKSLEFNYHIHVVPYVIAIIACYIDQYKDSIYGKYLVPLGFYSFFGVLLMLKVYKAEPNTDHYYQELLNVIEKDKKWHGRTIYVYGLPDISNYLIERNQRVERQNAVAKLKNRGWHKKFNYVIQIKDNWHPKEAEGEQPWLYWKKNSSYTSTNGHYTLITYEKDTNPLHNTSIPKEKILQSYND